MHHAEILIGHFGEMVGNWPLPSCYFALSTWSPAFQLQRASYSVPLDPLFFFICSQHGTAQQLCQPLRLQ